MSKQKKRLRDGLVHLAKVVFAVGLLGLLISQGKIDFHKVVLALTQSYWMGLAWILGFFTILFTAWRWHQLLHCQHIRLSFRKTWQLVFIGYFFNVVIPGVVSGDVVKAYYAMRVTPHKIAAGLSVIMDRLLGLMVLMFIAQFAMMMNLSTILAVSEFKIMALGISAGVIVCLGWMFWMIFRKQKHLFERWPAFLRQGLEAFRSYRSHPKTLVHVIGISVLNFGVNFMLYMTCLMALDAPMLPLSQYLFLIPVGMFVMAIPIAPAGLGVGQGVFLVLFQWAYGRPLTVGADMITLVQMVVVSWALVGCVVYLLHRDEIAVSVVVHEDVKS